MMPISIPAADCNDAELVEQSLTGDRQAFGRIVARYQSLICALAYSATGSRSQSEDLAQETFLTAWRKLSGLNEPSRLRSWLCGIARNVIHGELRRLARQPAYEADPLDTARELPSVEPLPTAQAVSNEEMAILWREVGRLHEMYREPLILFYREHKSVEHVAGALNLTPDAVMQRLTRARRQLQERMLEFVETTLERTNPGPQFAFRVEAALPVIAGAGPAATLAGAAAKGGGAAKVGLLGFLQVWATPLVGLFAAIGMSWAEIAQAPSPQERRFVARCMLALWVSVAVFVLAVPSVVALARSAGFYHEPRDWTATAPLVAVWFGFTLFALTVIVLLMRGKTAIRRKILAEKGTPFAPAAPLPMSKRVGLVAGFLLALFWVPIFLSWQTGDRAVASGIVAGVFLLGAVPLWLGRSRSRSVDEAKAGSWYVAICGFVFLGLLNWRLDVWLAPIYRVDLETMHRLLPMTIVHALSAVAVAWTAGLLFVTRPRATP